MGQEAFQDEDNDATTVFQRRERQEVDDDHRHLAEERMGRWEAIWKEPGLCQKFLATAGTWFLFYIVYYGNAIFQPLVIEAAFGGGDASTGSRSSLDLLRKASTDTLVLNSIALPGYAVAGCLIGKRTCCVTQTP